VEAQAEPTERPHELVQHRRRDKQATCLCSRGSDRECYSKLQQCRIQARA
jgi:hypothetical protein